MEYYQSHIHESSGNTSNSMAAHDGYSKLYWSTNTLLNSMDYTPPAATAVTESSPSAFHDLMLHHQLEKTTTGHSSSSSSSSLHDVAVGHYSSSCDPHLTCLKLGKRNYFERVAERHVPVPGPSSMTKKATYRNANKTGAATPSAAVVPRCQVEGCEAVLVNSKEYHRRHKVCEIHAKSPKVVVLGIEQRFCQQCSRFHGVAEFDESKRSCRRRLAGHNERRRKSSQDPCLSKKPSQAMATSRDPHFPHSSSDCALSLLSSTNNYLQPWDIHITSNDLPANCGAALGELIAENRASVRACRQQFNSNQVESFNPSASFRAGSDPQENGRQLTLELMQSPSSAFGLLSVHDEKTSKEGEECSGLWKVPLGY